MRRPWRAIVPAVRTDGAGVRLLLTVTRPAARTADARGETMDGHQAMESTPIIAAIVGAAVMLFVALGSLVLVLFTWLRSDIREVRQDVKDILGRQFSPKDFLAAQAAYERVMAVQEAQAAQGGDSRP